MKTLSVPKTGLDFSLSELPCDYAYRYTLYFILKEKMGESDARVIINKIATRLGVKMRMFQYYLYAKPDDNKYKLDEEKQSIIAEELGIESALLLAPTKTPE